MATLATFFDRFTAAKSMDPVSARTHALEAEESYEVPSFPNEDVYFYVERIVNPGGEGTDPAARKACWRMIGYSFLLATLVISLLLPTLYQMMAGYRMEALRQERERLELNRAALELQESRLVSPARLEELARMQRFVDPAPDSVMYLEKWTKFSRGNSGCRWMACGGVTCDGSTGDQTGTYLGEARLRVGRARPSHTSLQLSVHQHGDFKRLALQQQQRTALF